MDLDFSLDRWMHPYCHKLLSDKLILKPCWKLRLGHRSHGVAKVVFVSHPSRGVSYIHCGSHRFAIIKMLKVKHEHFYGSQEKHDLQLVKMILDTSVPFDEAEALDNGWLISDGEWYQCRSVRINAEEYYNATKQPKRYPNMIFELVDDNLDEDRKKDIESIYKQFTNIKGFDVNYNLFSDLDRSAWIIAVDDGVPVAFTKFIKYNGGLESQFTAWNYHKPKMSLGKNIIWYEMGIASYFGFDDYLYIGQGYENGSKYKADIPGFEWWTGSEWSKDVDRYKELCSRDSAINTIDDITRAYNGPHNS